MPRQIQGSQRDFSFGEVDVDLKRADDHPARKGGLRQMLNARIHNSGTLSNRSGRRALFPITFACTRIEKVTMSAGNNFKIAFGNARLLIRDNTETVVLNVTTQGNGAALPWTTATLKNAVFTVFGLSIYVTFTGMRPQVLTWDGVVTWTIADYTETIAAGGQKRTTFYRLSPQSVTMKPSATTGAITLAFSSPIVVAGMVGTRMRFCGRQLLLGAVIDASTINATVIEPLPPSQTLTVTGAVGTFNTGDVIEGAVSGAQGILTTTPNQQTISIGSLVGSISVGDAVTGGTSGATGIVTGQIGTAKRIVALSTGTPFVAAEVITGPSGHATIVNVSAATLVVQLLAPSGLVTPFLAAEKIVGPSSSATTTAAVTAAPTAVSVWDEEAMNDFRGYPAACFTDQFRLGFCNFPSIPGGIGWSAINSPFDLYANDASSPDNSIFEIAPGKVQVYYVIPGPESNEFVLCAERIYYIPISPTNPLKPGSVAFQLLSGDGAAQVQPRISQELILYVNAGQNSMMAIGATGAYLRPFNTRNLSDYHSHLFNAITAIAVPTAYGTFNERYAYVLNGDGSITVGKYNPESLLTSLPVIGWGPWSGAATVNWIAAWNADVFFTSAYFGTGVCEVLDDSKYLDCSISVNALPTPFTPSGGKGPLWFIPSQTVTLMDQVTRAMGTYVIDANGFIVPQFNGGEDLTLASLVAGQPWTATIEPFVPDAQPGADMGQRMKMRQFGGSGIVVYFINSTGFLIASLFSGKQTAAAPALGTIMNQRRIPTWDLGDDATKPPLQREWVESWVPSGSSFDPRAAIIKDTPGPLIITEIAVEISL